MNSFIFVGIEFCGGFSSKNRQLHGDLICGLYCKLLYFVIGTGHDNYTRRMGLPMSGFKCRTSENVFGFFFSVRLLSVLRSYTIFSSLPQRPISIPDFIHYIYFPILIFEKEPVFPFLMFSAKTRELPGTIFITSLV